MAWSNLAAIGGWWQNLEPALPLVMAGVSIAILLGCAIASWLCPSKKEDCLFHRQVM